MRVCGERHDPTVLTPGKGPGGHRTGGWVGSRAGLEGCGRSRPPTEIRSPVCPARIVLLYRLSHSSPHSEVVSGNSKRSNGNNRNFKRKRPICGPLTRTRKRINYNRCATVQRAFVVVSTSRTASPPHKTTAPAETSRETKK